MNRVRTITDALAIVAVVATMANVAAARRRGHAERAGGPYIGVARGQLVAAPVVAAGGVPAPLHAIAPGSCAYLVIVGPECGAGAAVARAWARAVRTDTAWRLPPSWFVAWVSVGDSAATANLWPRAFPFPKYSAPNDELARDLDVTAFPARLVLGRDGRVLFTDVGAPFPRPEQFRADCTIGDPRGTTPERVSDAS